MEGSAGGPAGPGGPADGRGPGGMCAHLFRRTLVARVLLYAVWAVELVGPLALRAGFEPTSGMPDHILLAATVALILWVAYILSVVLSLLVLLVEESKKVGLLFVLGSLLAYGLSGTVMHGLGWGDWWPRPF